MLQNSRDRAGLAGDDQIAKHASDLRRRGWTAADIEKELGISYADARRLVRRSDAQHGRPPKTVRNARKTPQQATVREIRQNVSKLLRRVKAGETIEVLERGRPVALLIPKRGEASALQRLIASGRVVRSASGPLADLRPPLKLRLAVTLSEALQELREDRS